MRFTLHCNFHCPCASSNITKSSPYLLSDSPACAQKVSAFNLTSVLEAFSHIYLLAKSLYTCAYETFGVLDPLGGHFNDSLLSHDSHYREDCSCAIPTASMDCGDLEEVLLQLVQPKLSFLSHILLQVACQKQSSLLSLPFTIVKVRVLTPYDLPNIKLKTLSLCSGNLQGILTIIEVEKWSPGQRFANKVAIHPLVTAHSKLC